jgi:ABC-type branched-subunit amino acid transport system substrate-binding protein
MKSYWIRKALASFLILSGTAACTFISNETSTQCRSQADCLSRGPEFAETTCTEARVCEKIAFPEKACTKNQECIDQNGGAPYTCRRSDGKCVSLLSANCQTLFADKEDLIDDNLVVIGGTLPFDENGRQANFAVSLARSEIKRLGGLAPATPDGPRRPLAVVTCTGEHASTAASVAMFSHLANTLQVPFVAGPFTSQETISGMNLFISKGILSITQNSLIEVTTLADNDLSFRVNFSDILQVKTMNAYIQSFVDPAVRDDSYCNSNPSPPGPPCTPFALPPGEPLRVGLMTTIDAPGLGVTASVANEIKFNGKSATDNLADGNFAIFKVGNPADPIGHPTPESERNTGIAQAIAFKPHLIMYAGTPIDANVLGGDMGWLALNRVWPTGPGEPARPYGVMLIQGWTGPIIPLIGMSGPLGPESRRKYIGVRGLATGWDPPDFGKWVQGLKIAFPEAAGAAIVPIAAMSYERIYLFAYALAAIGNAPVQGVELARGLRKVAGSGGGKIIKWGPEQYSEALAELAAGKNITYVGADGNFNFDKNGDRPGFGEVYCVPLRAGKIAGPISSGFTYDPETNVAKGTPAACLDN